MANYQMSLLDYLGNEFSLSKPDGVSDDVREFLEFANKFLGSNPPVSVESRQPGLGLRMRNGQTVSLIPGNLVPQVGEISSPVMVATSGSGKPPHPGDQGNIF